MPEVADTTTMQEFCLRNFVSCESCTGHHPSKCHQNFETTICFTLFLLCADRALQIDLVLFCFFIQRNFVAQLNMNSQESTFQKKEIVLMSICCFSHGTSDCGYHSELRIRKEIFSSSERSILAKVSGNITAEGPRAPF